MTINKENLKPAPTAGPSRLRQMNRKAILSNIRYGGSNSRLKLGKELSLSPAAVTSVVNELLNEGLLKDCETVQDLGSKESKPSPLKPQVKPQGRPISLLELQANAGYVFGIVLRPTDDTCTIDKAWADYSGKITTLDSSIGYDGSSLEIIIKGIQQALSELKQAVPNPNRIFGLTIGIPGVVNDNTIPIAPKLKCIEGSQFIHKIQKALPYPVSFQNDVNLGALSELHQQPRLRELSFAYLHVYSGVGSGISLKGNILNGSSGWAGEIGQLRIKRGIHHGNKQHPSFEQLLSTDGILANLLEQLSHPRDALDELVPYLLKNDKTIIKIINQYCENLCDAIRVLHCILDLDEVMIDFPSNKLFEQLLPRLQLSINDSCNHLIISTPAMGHQAGLHGAAINALNIALGVIELRSIDNRSTTNKQYEKALSN